MCFAFAVALFFGYQGGSYFLGNRLQEIGILFSLILFIYGAIVASFATPSKDLGFSLWFFLPLGFLIYIMVMPSYQFSKNAGVSMLPSVAASRHYIFLLIGPAIYFLYRGGLSVKTIERTILGVFGFITLSYLFHYFRLDLRAAYFSPDHTLSSLVTYDPWRGYRLRAPIVALAFITLLAPAMLFRAKTPKSRMIWFVVTAAMVYIWMLAQARSAIGTLLVGLMFYHVFFARKVRLGMLFMALPVMVPTITFAITQFLDHLSQLDPEWDGVRYKSYTIAVGVIKENPFFGFGQQSYSTVTEQELFWWKFFSTDIGLVGVGFKYGLVGVGLYLSFSYYSLHRLVSTNWAHHRKLGYSNLLLITFTAVFASFLLNLLLSPPLIVAPGIVSLSLALALTSIWRAELKKLPSS